MPARLLPHPTASRLPPWSRPAWAVLGIAAGPLVIALVGLTHPASLTPQTAHHWRSMHVLLVPLFPLVGVGLAWLVAGVPGVLGWLVRVLAYVHAAFYAAVDLLAGVGAGSEVVLGQDPFAGTVSTLFTAGNTIGQVGVDALLLGSVLAVVALWPALRVRALVWGALLLGGAYLFGAHHIYRPWGVLGMLVLAVGLAGLLRARQVGERQALRFAAAGPAALPPGSVAPRTPGLGAPGQGSPGQ